MSDDTPTTDEESKARYRAAELAWEEAKFNPDPEVRRLGRAAWKREWEARADFCDARRGAAVMITQPEPQKPAVVETVLPEAPKCQLAIQMPAVAGTGGQMGLFE